MKTVWVLLVLFDGAYSGRVLTTHSFNSRKACIEAAQIIIKTDRNGNRVEIAKCVEDRREEID